MTGFYDQSDEENRLVKSRHGQLEYAVTTEYIRRYAAYKAKIIEIGAGTGRYSVALARKGFDVTAVELVESNFLKLCENGRGLNNLKPFQGDGTDLSRFGDGGFDLTLVFGPMYHLYDPADVEKAIDEAIRVTKPGGTLFFAFISVFGIMSANYFDGNWAFGQNENFTKGNAVRHFKEQLFTGYDVAEFERLFDKKPVTHLATAGVDWILESLEQRQDFNISDDDFKAFTEWYLAFCEKRELLGHTNHLLYICRRNAE